MSNTSKPSASLHFMAGGIGGTVGAALLCPLEVAKTRLQSSLYKTQDFTKSKNPFSLVSFHVKGVFRMLYKIQQEEGFRALWKGLGVNLVGVVPARAIYFSTYSQGKHLYTQINNDKETSLVHMLSAATAGTATAICTNPIWVAKTRVQLDSSLDKGERKYTNSFNALKIIIKEEGIRGLYKGLSASILGLSESTIQFVLYEYLKKKMLSRKNSVDSIDSLDSFQKLETFGTAATAKLIAAMLTYPHEVLRTRLRQAPVNGIQKYNGLVESFRIILKEEGVSALYGGMTAHLLRVVPNAAILFFCYELVIHSFEKNEK